MHLNIDNQSVSSKVRVKVTDSGFLCCKTWISITSPLSMEKMRCHGVKLEVKVEIDIEFEMEDDGKDMGKEGVASLGVT